MVRVVTTANGVKTEHEITPGPRNFTLLVHQQGLRVDVPEFTEINPKNTIACMEAMTQKQWDWISTGPLFKTLFYKVFDQEQEKHFSGCQIPLSIDELNQGDMGVAHICGMIVLGCESLMAGKSVFVRNPETYLHPAAERMVVGMFYKMMEMFGVGGKIQTAVEEDPENLVQPKIATKQPSKEQIKEQYPEENPTELVVRWLSCMDLNKKFAQVGNKIYTVTDMIVEVSNETAIGKQLVEQFMNNSFVYKNKKE